MKFEVNQVWQTRNGEVVVIREIDDAEVYTYPVAGSLNDTIVSYTNEGVFDLHGTGNCYDLIRLIGVIKK